jgi:hypothetical protein
VSSRSSNASVGQAGGTGYIAAMGLLGFAPDVIKPTALNVLVAAIGCIRFHRAGLLTWRTCHPFALLGAPFSSIGGAVDPPPAIGGESGPRARPMAEQWVAEIEAACRKARTAFFFKQWGGVRKKNTGRHYRGRTFDEMPRAAAMS